MSKRANMFSLLQRKGYTEVPVDLSFCPYLEELYQEKTHSPLHYVDYFKLPWRNLTWIDIEEQQPHQFDSYYDVIDDHTEIDQWGVGHRYTESSMHMNQMLHPLEKADSVEQILSYPFPISKEDSIARIAEDAEQLKKSDLIAVANLQMTIWETSWYLRGMENLMMDMMMEDDMATALLDKVTDIAITNAQIYTKSGADILFLGDDIGMQSTTLMSKTLYQTWIKPRLAKVIKEAKKINPNLLIFYHSCGYVEPFIPDLIEVGVDVLNPVQPECMDFEKIHAQYGDQISFHGTIGTQTTMPFGTPEEVRHAVEKNLTIAGEKGGLFVSPTHVLEPEVPWENILAYVDTCNHFLG